MPSQSIWANPWAFAYTRTVFSADRHHDGRHQVAHRPILIDQFLELLGLAVGYQVRVSYGAAESVAPVVLNESDAQGAVGIGLQAAVDRGVHLVAGAFGVRSKPLAQLQAHHFRNVGRLHVIQRRMRACQNRFVLRRGVSGVIDVPQVAHAAEHIRAPPLGELGIGNRVVVRRGLGESGNGGRLGHGKLVERFSKEGFGCRRNAISALAEENNIKVKAENLLLGKGMLHFVGNERLLELAPHSLIQCQEYVTGGLHGDGAGSLGLMSRDKVYDHGADHPQVVNAVMFEETLVFGRQEGAFDHVRNLVVIDWNTPLFADLCDQLSTARVNTQGDLHLDVAH